MGEMKESKKWFVRHAETEAKKDAMPYLDRAGNFVAVAITVLVTLYFAAHQMQSTGFFTSRFGSLEMFLFYSFLIYQIVPAVLKVIFGRRNLARFFEIFGGVLGTVVLLWLFVVFPFDFTHFADVLPGFLRFLVQWISNDIARVLMALGAIAAPVMTIYTAVLYVFVRGELSEPTLETA